MKELFCWFSGGAVSLGLFLSGADLLTWPREVPSESAEFRHLAIRARLLEGECERLNREALLSAVERDRLRRAALREPLAPAPATPDIERIPAPAVPFPTR